MEKKLSAFETKLAITIAEAALFDVGKPDNPIQPFVIARSEELRKLACKEIVPSLLAKIKEMREAQRNFDETRITGWMYKVQRLGAEIDEALNEIGI